MRRFDEKKIRQQLDKYDDSYYNEYGEIEDPEYDALLEYYESMSGKKYRRVGAPPREGRPGKTKLRHFMGSIDCKIKGADAQKKLDKYALKYPGPWMVIYKADGNSTQYTVDREDEIKRGLFSRNDGTYGYDISWVLDILELPIPEENTIIRGEMIMSKKYFQEYVERERAKGSEKKLNCARNVGSGILNRIDNFDEEAVSQFLFLPFCVQSEELSTLEHYRRIEELGFTPPKYVLRDSLEIEDLRNLLKEGEETADYDIDGLVIAPAHGIYPYPKGSNPKHLIAFKEDKCKATTVTKVEWNVSAKGKICPTVHFETVFICNGNLSKATGHNAKFIISERIGPGAHVLVSRASTVSPQVVKVLLPALELDLPDCEYEWDNTETNFYILDPDQCREVLIQRMVHFVKNMGIENLSSGRIESLYNAGINTIKKLITCSVDEIAACERLGLKSATTIKHNIQNAISRANMCNVMVASNVFGIGFAQKKIASILAVYPYIIDHAHDEPGTVEQMLIEIGGFQKMAKVFEKKLPLFTEWLRQHEEIVIVEDSPEEQNEGFLKDEIIVFTGFSGNSKQYAPLVQEIRNRGGEFSNTVTKKTTILVAKDVSKASGKTSKLSPGARLISLQDFLEEYNIEF